MPERSATVASTSAMPGSPSTRRRVASSSESSAPGSAPGRYWRASASASRATAGSPCASASVAFSLAGSTRSGSNAVRTAGRARRIRS